MILATEKLRFGYDDKVQFSYPDIQINKNEELLLLGKSGSGKTTLLHLLSGFLKPSSGSIQLLGEKFSNLSTAQKDKFRGKHIGMVFQKPHLIKAISAINNIKVAAKASGIPLEVDYYEHLLDVLDVIDKKNMVPGRLSLGEQQRVNIARALACHPQLIFADEPTSALDDENCDRVFDILLKVKEINHSALMIVTHDNRLTSKVKTHVHL